MIRIKIRKIDDKGSSFIEILLAVILLGFLSVNLLNAVASGNKVVNKNTDKQMTFNYLASAAEVISKENYQPCNQLTTKDKNGVINPYFDSVKYLSDNLNPTVIYSVEALGSDKNWHPCGDAYWGQYSERPSFFQKVKLCIPDTSLANPCDESKNKFSRYIFKNLERVFSGYTVQASETLNTCSSNYSNSLNIVSGYLKNVSLQACNSAYNSSNSSNLVYYTLPGTGPQAISTSCSVSNSNDFSIALIGSTLSICPGKTYVPDEKSVKKVTIEIGAIDLNNSAFYNPITLAVNVYYPPTLVQPDRILTESGLSLFGCSSNLLGCQNTNLKYVGGIPNVPVSFNLKSVTPSSTSLLGAGNVALNSSTGDLSLTSAVTNSSSSTLRFTTTVALSGGGLPYAVDQTPFDIVVNPTINFYSSYSMSCGTSSCSSGSLLTQAASGLLDLANLRITSSNPSVSPTITSANFDVASSKWTFNISASFTCQTKKVSGKTVTVPMSSTFYLSDSVAINSNIFSSIGIAFNSC